VSNAEPAVSIVVATYNRAQLLDDFITAVKNKTAVWFAGHEDVAAFIAG